ncbi:MAG: SUMF1/EgtB/PvdO family nonheme iron enzyme [Planctomycetota bacterium]|nr:SUMF1/EgtB/PvdO family nonheme iron enzyme [Planctomycetota bacterium]
MHLGSNLESLLMIASSRRHPLTGGHRTGFRRPSMVIWAVVFATMLVLYVQGSKGAVAAAAGKEVFSCTFENGLSGQLRIVGGKWEVKEDCLWQMDAGSDDPNKVVLVVGDAEDLSTGIVVVAKLRIDSWKGNEWSRAGISCCSDAQSGNGLNLIFHQGRLQFMHDYVAWGPSRVFPFATGKWYWMKLHKTAGEMKGKAWLDGDAEPADWMVTWRDYSPEVIGYPALVGCSGNAATGDSRVSFAQCSVVATGEGPSAIYAKKATWHETMAAGIDGLARQKAELAAASGGPAEQWGPWHHIGPFHSAGKSAFAEAFPPETEVDLARSYGNLRWTAHPEWVDGVVHYDLDEGNEVAAYLYRTVTVKAPTTITGYFGSDDGMVVWLNGKKVVSRDVARSAAANQDQAKLDLVAGENKLLVKIRDHSGPSGFYFSTSPEAASKSGDPQRERLWRLVQRDFPDARSRREMAWEREDGIWALDWAFGNVSVLAGRYAGASRAGFGGQASELARKATTAADLTAVRGVYYRSRDIDQTLGRWKDSNLRSLRLAVEDLARTQGARYPKGLAYLGRIDELRKAVAAARAADGRIIDIERLVAVVRDFEALQTEALLANRLLDFDRLLLVKRRDARGMKPQPALRMPFPNDAVGHLNGLPTNFQGTGALRQIAFDNEIAVLSPVRPDGGMTTVFRPVNPVYVGDIKLHFDAGRLLFSSIGSHSRFQVFETGVDGQGFRQVTPGDEKDIDSYDACYLPDGRIVFGSSSCFQSVPCERRLDEVSTLHVMNSDGSGVRRLCFDQDHNFYPTMMSDGRVLYTRWEYTDIAHAFSARLFTMNPDGTQQRAFYASSGYWPNRIFYAKPVPDNDAKFVGVISGHHGTARAGELVLFDVGKGRRQADGVVQRIPGRGQSVEPVMVDGLVDGSWPKFLHPYPLSEKYFLVSCQPTKDSRWGIYLVDVFDNMVLLHETDGYVLFEPVPVRKTPRPRVIPDRVNLASREGTVYLSDIYAGNGLKGIPRGAVKRLRLFTYHFNYYGTSGIEDYIGMDGPWDIRRVLGTVPVAEDGSAYFTVPANTPISVQPLDAEGKALQLMRSWFTAMPGEVVSCVGCHEDANLTPTTGRPSALARPPSQIAPWHGRSRGFSWDREVQPVLDKYCVGCHDDQQHAGSKMTPDLRRADPRVLPLSDALFPPSFYALRRFVRSPGLEGNPQLLPPADYHADTNPLVQMLRKGHHNVQIDAEAWDRLVTWIDLNAPAYGTWLEIPSARGNATALQCRVRRIEMARRYGGIEEDPEAIPEDAREPVIPVIPPPEERPSRSVRVSGWPFSVDEAKRRQANASASTQLEIELAAGVRMQLVLIPAGELAMGDATGYADEKPVCKVKIDRPLWMGKVEVTNQQYACFDPAHQSGDEGKMWLRWSRSDFQLLDQPKQPVCRVSWDQANAFCRWLSQRTSRKFALPDEAQWEWACRAGTDTALSYGPMGADSAAFANLADVALLNLCQGMEKVRPFLAVDQVDDGSTVSAAVGSYRPNRWGLLDMHGNVAEWTNGAYLPYPFNAGDPRHAAPGARKVVRGGSWYDRADLARSGCRISYWPWQRVFNVGFRVVCEAL